MQRIAFLLIFGILDEEAIFLIFPIRYSQRGGHDRGRIPTIRLFEMMIFTAEMLEILPTGDYQK